MREARLGRALMSGALALAAPAVARAEVVAGVGKVSVTTPAAELPYAASTAVSLNTGPGEKPFVGVHDEVFARALVLGEGSRRAALVVLETTAIPAAADIAAAVAQAIGAKPAEVMLAATHTHSVPLFSYAGAAPNPREQAEIARLKRGAVEAARIAAQSMRPARVAFARGQAHININNGEQAGLRSGFDPAGPSDKSLDVVRLEGGDGKPIALLVNYSSHAEVMFRSVSKDGGYEISGDIPGAVSRLLEARADAAPVVLFTAGAEADQLSLFKSLQRAGRLPDADAGAGGWTLLDVQARQVAEATLATLAAMPPAAPLTRFATAADAVICKGQQIRLDPAGGAPGVVPKPDVTIPLSLLRINDIVLGGVGGDVATQIGLRFKAASPLPATTMVTLAGNSVGYIFADASYARPGHGLSKSLLAPGCAEPAIVDGLVGLIGRAK